MKPRKKFNWLTTLRRLAKNGAIKLSEHNQLSRKATSWPDCACGQLCKKLPRKPGGYPADYKLFALGCTFCSAVCQKQWRLALRTFLKIEKRTAVLLRTGGKR